MINKDVREQIDSLARLAIEEQAERLLNTLEEKKTTVVHFDTDKPTDDSTGLPPVKTIVTQETKREEQRQEKRQSQVYSETGQKQETIDKSIEETATAVEVESWWDTFKQRIMYILLIPLLIIALWATYKLIKFLK